MRVWSVQGPMMKGRALVCAGLRSRCASAPLVRPGPAPTDGFDRGLGLGLGLGLVLRAVGARRGEGRIFLVAAGDRGDRESMQRVRHAE